MNKHRKYLLNLKIKTQRQRKQTGSKQEVSWHDYHHDGRYDMPMRIRLRYVPVAEMAN